jgi:YVTN family beta-propeller protein
MNILRTSILFLSVVIVAALSSCKKDGNNAVTGVFSKGIFIVNEGPFQSGSGTITYFQPDSSLVKQDIFEAVNGRPLGNIAQSMTIYNGKGYIVVNNAGTVEVVDIATFKSSGTITGLVNPSELLVVDAAKAYVSDWAGQIAVVDLNSNTITKTIAAASGPDAMLKSGNYVYVANSGGLGIDSIVTVIDFKTDKVVKVIPVGESPSGIVADGNGKIWVVCKGMGYNGYPYPTDTPGRLVRIDPASLAVDYTYYFTSNEIHPEKLHINEQKSMLYFLYNYGIYRFSLLSANALPEKLVSRSFYSLGYESKTGYLYASDVKNYVSEGVVLRIKADDGTVVDSLPAGIVPRGFSFPQ